MGSIDTASVVVMIVGAVAGTGFCVAYSWWHWWKREMASHLWWTVASITFLLSTLAALSLGWRGETASWTFLSALTATTISVIWRWSLLIRLRQKEEVNGTS